MNWCLRPFRPEDLHRVVDVFTRSVHELGRSAYSSEQLAAWAPEPPLARSVWLSRLSKRCVLVAQPDREHATIAGFVGFEEPAFGRPEGVVDLLFVDPRFTRRGAATALYQEAERRLVECGAVRLRTHASDIARKFFAGQGFTVSARECVEVRGVLLRRSCMYKELGGDLRRQSGTMPGSKG